MIYTFLKLVSNFREFTEDLIGRVTLPLLPPVCKRHKRTLKVAPSYTVAGPFPLAGRQHRRGNVLRVPQS